MQTWQFQRLHYLKQLGLAYLVYPGATHTRGHHSLNCLNEAEKILNVINPSEEDRQDVRMAALLHDIGHIPFSHTLEDEHIVLEKHDRPQRLNAALGMLKAELTSDVAEAVERATPILYAISGDENEQPNWKRDLVGNTVCADLLAYITMDATWTGIEKRSGHYRIYEYFHRSGDDLCIKLTKGGSLRTDIVSAIMDLLEMRYALTERVLFHHAKCVASGMLARAARLCGLGGELENLTFRSTPLTEERLLGMGDERFLEMLEELAPQREKQAAEGALNLVQSLKSRRLYQRVFKVGRESRETADKCFNKAKFTDKWRNPQEVESLLCAVEDEVGVPRGSLILWCPEKKASMKQAEANVIWGSDETGWINPVKLNKKEVEDQFEGVHNRVTMIQKQYLDLWTFWIALDRKHIDKAAAVVRVIGEHMEITCDPSFSGTSLVALPGYKENADINKQVRKVMSEVEADVESSLLHKVALDGQSHLDKSAILTAVSQVSADKAKGSAPKAERTKTKPKDTSQGQLPISSEPEDESSA